MTRKIRTNKQTPAGLREGVEAAGLQRPVQVREADGGGTGAEGLGGLENLDNLENLGNGERATSTRPRRVTPEEDAAYLAAVERGDMETAARMVREAAERAGYSDDASWRMSHHAPNRETAEGGSAIRMSDAGTEADKLMPKDAWTHPEWYFNMNDPMERESFSIISAALREEARHRAAGDGKHAHVIMYRGVDKSRNRREASFRNGDWCTPSRAYASREARENAGGGRVIEMRVSLANLYWDGNSISEFGYDNGKNLAYKDTKNNRKLLDPVTRDAEGNVIPLSRRFDKTKSSIRFSVGPVYTGSAADYAHRREDGAIENGPSLHKIGSGEGVQAYGWGLYASNRRGVAEGYAKRDATSKQPIIPFDTGKVFYKGREINEKGAWDLGQIYAASHVKKFDGDIDKAIENAKRLAEYGGLFEYERNAHLDAIEFLEQNRGEIEYIPKPHISPNIYEQTFFTNRATPEETERHLLKWYEPVSEEQLEWIDAQYRSEFPRSRQSIRDRLAEFREKRGEPVAANLYEILSDILDGGPQAASEFLARAGIDGIKYPVDSYGKPIKDGDVAGWNYVSFRDDNIRVDHKWRDGEKLYARGGETGGAGADALNAAARALEKALGVTVEVSADMPEWAREQSKGAKGEIRAAIDPATGRVWLSSRLADEGSAAHEGAHWIDAVVSAAAASGDAGAKAAAKKFAEIVANCPEALRKKIMERYGEVTDSEIFAHMAEAERKGELGEMLSGTGRPARTWWEKVKRAFALAWQAVRRQFGASLKASDLGRMDWRDALHQMNEAMRTGQKIAPVGRAPGDFHSSSSSGGVSPVSLGGPGRMSQTLRENARKIHNVTQAVKLKIRKWRNGDAKIAVSQDPNKVIGGLRSFFGMRYQGKSNYVTLETDGVTIETPKGFATLRISDHTAVSENFRRDGTLNNVSVFISDEAFPRENGEIPYVEFQFPETVFRQNPARVVDAIVNGVDSLIRTGVFVDDSGLSIRVDHPARASERAGEGIAGVQYSRGDAAPERNLGHPDAEEQARKEEERRQWEKDHPQLPGAQWRPRSSTQNLVNGVVTYDDAELVGVGGWFTAKVARYQGRDGKPRWAVRGADGKNYIKNIETEEQAKWYLGHRRAELARSVDALAGADKDTVVRIAEARKAFIAEMARQDASKADKVEAVHKLMRDLKIDDELWKQEAQEVMHILREHPIYGRNTAAESALRFVDTVLAREACRIRKRRVKEIFDKRSGQPKYPGGPPANETAGMRAARKWAFNKDGMTQKQMDDEEERLQGEARRLEDKLHSLDIGDTPTAEAQEIIRKLAECYENMSAIRHVGGLFTFHDPDAKTSGRTDDLPARDYAGDLAAWDQAVEWLEKLVETSATERAREEQEKEEKATAKREKAIDELLGSELRIDNINDLNALNSKLRKRLYNAVMFYKMGVDAGFSLGEQLVYDKKVGFGQGTVYKMIEEVEDAQHAEAQRNEDSDNAIIDVLAAHFGKDPRKSFKDRYAFDSLLADVKAGREGKTEVKRRKLVKNKDGSYSVALVVNPDGSPKCFEQSLAELMPLILWRRQAEEAAGCSYEDFIAAFCNGKTRDIDFRGRPEEERRFGMMMGLAKSGFLPETIDEAAALLKKNNLLELTYSVSKLFDIGYDDLNAMVRYMYGGSLTKVDYYCPAKREFYRMTGPAGPAGLESFMSMLASFIRERTDNSRQFELYDIFDRLLADAHRKNHMITHYKVVDEARRVFQHPDMQRALIQKFGEKAKGHIDEYWNTIARGGHQVANHDAWYQLMKKVGTAYAAAQIPRITTAIKQTTSPTATMAMMPEDMTTAQFFKWMGVVQWPKERDRYKALMNRYLPGWRWRLKGHVDQAMQAVMESGDGKRYRAFVRAAKNVGAKVTTWGDAWACVTGSYPIFRYWHDKLVAEGKSEDAANREAMRKVSQAYNETQQSSLAAYQSAVQSNRYLVWASMFKSAPIAYTRMFYAHARALVQGRGNKWAHVRAILGLFAAQSAYLLAGGSIFAGAMLGSGGDDDDDDDGRILRKLAKTAGRAMVGVPTEGLPGGTVATYLWDKFVADENMYGRDPIEMGAPLAVIDEAVNIVSELVREDGPRAGRLGSSLSDVIGAITTLPIPGLFATTSGAIDAFTADDLNVPQRIGRFLGYSRSAVEAPRAE